MGAAQQKREERTARVYGRLSENSSARRQVALHIFQLDGDIFRTRPIYLFYPPHTHTPRWRLNSPYVPRPGGLSYASRSIPPRPMPLLHVALRGPRNLSSEHLPLLVRLRTRSATRENRRSPSPPLGANALRSSRSHP